MSLPKDIVRHRLFWTWHRRVGIVVALLVLVLSLTGLALNHTDRLGLDDRYVSWGWLLDWYGIESPAEAVSFPAGDARVTLLGDRLYLDRRILPGHFNTLSGATAADGFLAVAADNGVLIITGDGQIVDRLGAESGVPGTIDAVGADESGRILLRSGQALYGADVNTLAWVEVTAGEGTIRWAESEPVDALLLSDLRRDFRARIMPVERVLLDAHSGRIAGTAGTLLMDAAAVLLLVLALTGSWLWLMRRG